MQIEGTVDTWLSNNLTVVKFGIAKKSCWQIHVNLLYKISLVHLNAVVGLSSKKINKYSCPEKFTYI